MIVIAVIQNWLYEVALASVSATVRVPNLMHTRNTYSDNKNSHPVRFTWKLRIRFQWVGEKLQASIH